LEGFGLVNAVKGPQELKKEDFQNSKINFPRYSSNLQIPNSKTQKGRFWKNEKAPPGTYPIHKCVKFQHDWAIFDFPRLP